MPSVGLALIAKNEEKRLPNLLSSIEGAFDQVVLVDTGSTDRTKQVFDEWAKIEQDRNANFTYIVKYFHWCKDFGAARTFAHSLLETEWEVWADCDDVITGAQNIRQVIDQAPEQVMGFVCGYNYAQHPQTGQPICYLKRERIIRKGSSEWVNRVHEAQVVHGPVMQLESNVVEWIHQKQYISVEEMHAEDARRNIDILESWVLDEPNNTRVLAYLGTENAARDEIDTAIQYFSTYFSMNPDWDEERAQVHRKVAMCYMLKGEFDMAIETAFDAMRVLPSWTDSYITLGEAYLSKGDYGKALEWGREALRRGQPDTMLIINPLDYTFQPRKIIAGSLAAMEQLDEAIKIGTEAWHMNPADQGLASAIREWQVQSKKYHTANTIAMLAQALVAHDEQLKALDLLELCVPHFALDHSGIVNLRSELRERLAWVFDPRSLLEHYAEGGSKPEDFLPDDKIDEVAGNLPRTAFLYQGIHEQLIEAHHDGLMDQAIEEQFPAMAAVVGHGNPS